MVTTLADLSIGQSARVTAVEAGGDLGVRLLEMGLIPGTDVSLVGKAPLGDPLVYEFRGYRLSLRRAEAAVVAVERA